MRGGIEKGKTKETERDRQTDRQTDRELQDEKFKTLLADLTVEKYPAYFLEKTQLC